MARQARPSLSEATTAYLGWLGHAGAKASTVGSYRDELKRFQQFVRDAGLDDPPVGDIDPELLRRFQLSLDRARRDSDGVTRSLSRETKKHRLVVLRQLLGFASERRWLREDLASTIVLPPPGASPLPKRLNKEHLERLVDSLSASTAKEKRDKAFILLLLSTGVRLSEVLHLDREDLKHNKLILRGDGDQERTLTLTKRARKAVETYRASRKDPSPALFIGLQPARRGKDANRLTPTGARYICKTISSTFHIPAFSPKQLRHTTGVLLQAEGSSPLLAASTLGLTPKSVAGYRRLARETLERAGL